ncbi:MAG TPA: RNA 2',3'-cyclic phosphodiesterase [Thermoanaerobaculia bacterium]|jgi:2'-5' RNA ligase|nr:RNA 2',3'-cyclic phosphodiesterase [Thermoanaerobaculia bacterium]
MRLFIAAHFPEEVLRDLNDRTAHLTTRLPAASWVRPGAQHLTFAFLGEQPEALVEKIAPPLTDVCGGIAKFGARLSGCGFFPNPRRARVGWIGLDPETQFEQVARAVREVVTTNGVALDGGVFKPHLTLMRMRDVWPPASIDLFTKSLRDYESAPFLVTEVTLFSSQLNPKGAVHTPLRTFPLSS